MKRQTQPTHIKHMYAHTHSSDWLAFCVRMHSFFNVLARNHSIVNLKHGYLLSRGTQTGVMLAYKEHLAMSEDFWLPHLGEGLLPACSGQRSGTMLNILNE